MKEIMCFLWDNYLEMHDSDDIVLMGVGDSYGAVRELLVNRGMHSFLVSLMLLGPSSSFFVQEAGAEGNTFLLTYLGIYLFRVV
jgi:hypothetical protein